MFLSTLFPLYKIFSLFIFSSSGGFIYLTENFRWDLLFALQIRVQKTSREGKNKALSWYLISIYQQI